MKYANRIAKLEAQTQSQQQQITKILLVDGITGEVGAEINVEHPMTSDSVIQVLKAKHEMIANGLTPKRKYVF